MCQVTHSYTSRDCTMTHSHVWHDYQINMTWLIPLKQLTACMCDMSLAYMWRDSSLWRDSSFLWRDRDVIHSLDATQSWYVWHVGVLCVTWLVWCVTWLFFLWRGRDVTYSLDGIHSSYVWHDSFLCVVWLILCVTWLFLFVTWPWRDSFSWCNSQRVCVTWLVLMCNVTRLLCDMTVMSLVDVCDVTHSYAWRDSFICVTWLIRMCDMTHSYV